MHAKYACIVCNAKYACKVCIQSMHAKYAYCMHSFFYCVNRDSVGKFHYACIKLFFVKLDWTY